MNSNGLSRTTEADSESWGERAFGFCPCMECDSEEESLSGLPSGFARIDSVDEIEIIFDELERVKELQVLTFIFSICSLGGLLISCII